ncbi:unnamed protein product [Nezara viridula]|uniref:Uncharacterized protein n=1 Tax=Nezara viridula TaxID=85310 RepID=A0A9P0HHF5_NEZVI|nr:unnamed protein product [Nezara viridula]
MCVAEETYRSPEITAIAATQKIRGGAAHSCPSRATAALHTLIFRILPEEQKKTKMRPPSSQFGADITNTVMNDNVAKMICTRLAGRAVIRVVSRCDEAKDNNNLGKSWLCSAST